MAGKDPGLAAELPRVGLRQLLGLDGAVLQGAGAPVPPEGRPPDLGGGRRADAHRRTAYRMLFGWPPHTVQHGDVVLVWGGAGGLGSLAVQLVANAGGRPVAVVSSEEKGDYAKSPRRGRRREPDGLRPLGRASGVGLARTGRAGSTAPRRFGKAIWEALGEKTSPRIVFEHPGQDTIPTSNFVCDRGGMIVICAGTSGYDTMIDVRYLWYMQKRYQGSHLFNDEQAGAFNELVREGKIQTTLGHTYRYDEIPTAHQLMERRQAPRGQRRLPRERPAAGAEGPALSGAPLFLSLLRVHQCLARHGAAVVPQRSVSSWTSSTSTPPVDFG